MKQNVSRELKTGLTNFLEKELKKVFKEDVTELKTLFGTEEVGQVSEGVVLKLNFNGETVFTTVKVTVKSKGFDFESEKEDFEQKRKEKLIEQVKKLDKLKEKEKELKGE